MDRKGQMTPKEFCNQPPGCVAPQVLEDIREIKEDLRELKGILQNLAASSERVSWLDRRIDRIQRLEDEAVTRRELHVVGVVIGVVLTLVSIGINIIFKIAR